MMENNKKMLMWVVVGVVVVAVGWFIFTKSNQTSQTSETNTEQESAQDIADQNTGVVSAVSISYANALVQYKDRRIQLDKGCQANPNIVTYKDNTGIMIDNRSAMAHTVKVGTTFSIKPWGFKIVVLPDIYLKAKTLLVDCDAYQNVATVTVQE